MKLLPDVYRKFLLHIWPSKWVLLIASLSLASSFWFVNLPRSGKYLALLPINIMDIDLVVIGLFVVAFWAIVAGFVGAFSNRGSGEPVSRILICYVAFIFLFAGLYYTISFSADLADAGIKYDHYRHESQLVRAGVSRAPRTIGDSRAFRGVDQRFWSGVDWPLSGHGLVALESSDSIARARLRRRDAIRYQPDRGLSIFWDCVHFSVATLTTLGFGDITPQSKTAKLVADLQVLSGVALVVFALGMALSGRWQVREKLPYSRLYWLRWLIVIVLVSLLFTVVGYYRNKKNVIDHHKYLVKASAASKAMEAGKVRLAEAYAGEALDHSGEFVGRWFYGDVIFDSNVVLGAIALRNKNPKLAAKHLVLAGASPGSPSLKSYGPDLRLANDLLKRGERSAVVQFLDLCEFFWDRREEVRKVKLEVMRGANPDLCTALGNCYARNLV